MAHLPDEPKRAATRRHLLDRALALFQKRGVEATTMRDIAKAAGMSLGAAYYHFPSKEALVFAYYEANQDELEAIAARATGGVRERLGALFHGKLESIRPHRTMLASIVPHLVNPGDQLSAFSDQTRAVRDRSVAVFAGALAGAGLPDDLVALASHALWMFMLGIMLVYIHDTSEGEARTHRLVDDGLDMIVPMLPMLGTPIGRAIASQITAALARADIAIA